MGFGTSSAGNTLKKEDLQNADGTYRTAVVTIESMRCVMFDDGEAWFIKFQGSDLELRANATNGKRIAAMFPGCPDPNSEAACNAHYAGKQIELYVDPMVEMRGQVVGGLRVRPVQAQPAPAPAAQQQPAANPGGGLGVAPGSVAGGPDVPQQQPNTGIAGSVVPSDDIPF